MTPFWLYDLFGVVVLAVAGYSMVLLVVTVATHRPAGWDVDVTHTLMGVAMAGMFVAGWAFGSKFVWGPIFAVLLIWFLARSALSIRQFGIHLPHFLVHGVLSLAMILMYAFPGVSASTPMPMSGGSQLDPGLTFFLAVCLFASAIFTVGSSTKGASHHGSHALVYAGASVGSVVPDRSVEGIITTPWVEDASHVAMCVTTGLLLLRMI